jgi:hypothetical protein
MAGFQVIINGRFWVITEEVAAVFKDTGCRFLNVGLGRRIWKTAADHPGGNRCVRTVESNLTDEDLDFLF